MIGRKYCCKALMMRLLFVESTDIELATLRYLAIALQPKTEAKCHQILWASYFMGPTMLLLCGCKQ